MPLVALALSWDNAPMAVPMKGSRTDSAPALHRLLAESALCRAALANCGAALAIVDAQSRAATLVYANAALLSLFGQREADIVGKPLATALFRGDDALVQRVVAEPSRRWELCAWTKDGSARNVDLALAPLLDCGGQHTHSVLVFSDRDELERLRAEVLTLRALAEANLVLRLEPGDEPARGAQKPSVEVAPADELHADRKVARILQQR